MKQFKYKFKGNSSPESIFENNLDIKDKKDETKKERSQLVFYKNTALSFSWKSRIMQGTPTTVLVLLLLLLLLIF